MEIRKCSDRVQYVNNMEFRKMKQIRKFYRFDDRTEKMLKENLLDINREQKKKITESEYIRDLICRDSMDRVGIDKNVIIDIRRQLAGLGNNINQIAHRFNSGLYDMYDIDNLTGCINDIRKIREFTDELTGGRR